MDHETALHSANQALGGQSSRSTSSFASVDIRGVAGLQSPQGHHRSAGTGLPVAQPRGLPNGAWEVAAMLSVGLVAVLVVLALWFL